MNRTGVRDVVAAWLCCAALAGVFFVISLSADRDRQDPVSPSAQAVLPERFVEARRETPQDTFENEADRMTTLAGLDDGVTIPAGNVSPVVAASHRGCLASMRMSVGEPAPRCITARLC
jgi:hypothetical protein